MGYSLKQRFNGNSAEVIQYAREHGTLETMREYDIKDYVSIENFLKELAPNEVFQVSKGTGNPATDPDYFDRFLEAIERRLANLSKLLADKETVIENQTKMITELQAKVDRKNRSDWTEKRRRIEDLMRNYEQGDWNVKIGKV